jgi:hypothetical protein
LIQQLLDEVSDATVEELRQALGARGHWFGYGTLQRFSSGVTASRVKKDGPRRGTGSPGHPETTLGVV